MSFPVDVSDEAAMAAAAAAIEDAIGPLDLAILGAGMFTPLEIDQFDVALIRRHLEINYMGAVHGIAALMPRFLARASGHFAVIASVAGYRGLPTAAAYGPTKAALINLCEALKPDLDRRGVRISIVNPGFVKTAMTAANSFRDAVPDGARRRRAPHRRRARSRKIRGGVPAPLHGDAEARAPPAVRALFPPGEADDRALISRASRRLRMMAWRFGVSG